MNIEKALQILERLTGILAKWRGIIAKAQAEGRDVTDAELEELKAERKAAVDEFLS